MFKSTKIVVVPAAGGLSFIAALSSVASKLLVRPQPARDAGLPMLTRTGGSIVFIAISLLPFSASIAFASAGATVVSPACDVPLTEAQAIQNNDRIVPFSLPAELTAIMERAKAEMMIVVESNGRKSNADSHTDKDARHPLNGL
jgi:hypothetical protein